MASNRGKCIFCDIMAGKLPAEIVYRDQVCIVLLDAFPLTRGHLLVIPHQHAQHVEELPAASVAQLFDVATRFSAMWRGRGGVSATNLMLNNGWAANQHVPHVHLHVIPRRRGDTLLMVWRFLTRFFNPLSYVGRRQRLAREAIRIRELVASHIESAGDAAASSNRGL